ncbi:glucose-1-phosphate cytidylyltransferase [Mucilaginibacter myungsuensis]|uniref:Glucose-1-phosphate cytidylyltransferase n=1 Tax=Mucilaginibacter myungsuensis TaxID=649104 RepID=A0A929PXH9_9SPHI|nr:glucose-1-phosphate cytidylyltransferase [Mucilaginibacter myungsuensis]MBE9662420.1 glucose-1-phosphate cytidylyltransferase [Mucilaginibacter myungsuensis]MDN3599143.1 glucose-1-phosphate cytidylyltransferase [Mucilaginibacter myungsuensis]
MKVVLLAGGLGTRLSEETVLKPKPMVEIGGMPILWHIMKIYSSYGYNDFIICLGYKGYVIKEYFANYFLHKSDVTIDLKDNSIKVHDSQAEPWTITLVDTGNESMTGGRIKRIKEHVGNEAFMLTYGDGVGNVNISNLVDAHKAAGKYCTVTSVQPSGRFGALNIGEDGSVHSFTEKPKGDGAWINGGFFVCEPQVFDYIEGDKTIWEREPMEKIAEEGQMMSFKHEGFWKPMDTLRDKQELEEDWVQDKAKWKNW